jgi:hypothetical protein
VRPGWSLFAWIQENLPELAGRVIFITGGAFTPRAAEFLNKVENIRVEKPFDAKRLRALVSDRINKTTGRPD